MELKSTKSGCQLWGCGLDKASKRNQKVNMVKQSIQSVSLWPKPRMTCSRDDALHLLATFLLAFLAGYAPRTRDVRR